MREYMKRRRAAMNTVCSCSKPAVRMVNGNEGICAVCLARDAAREMLRVMPKPPKKWDEPMPENGGERFWAHKLELWLPNPTPGWGSLELLEAKLATLNNRVAV